MSSDDALVHPAFGDYYRLIYAAGLAGERLTIPLEWAKLERDAEAALAPEHAAYIYGGAGGGATMRANRDAFDRWRIVPRMLRDVSVRDLSCRVLGTDMPAPVLLAPIAVQSIVHPDGELAVARAAARVGLPIVASTLSSFSLEQIAEAGGDAPRWFQLYWPKDPELAASMVRRAQNSGYRAVVVTLDNFLVGWRPRDLAEAWQPTLRNLGTANYQQDPVFRASLPAAPEDDRGPAISHQIELFPNTSLTWDDLSLLREHTTLPILLKGILHPDDAREACARGIDGVIVSNHGGRQVDGSIGALDALPAVVEAVAGRVAVLFDSGVRGGADVFKALALGAEAILLGRPYLWGLAVDGERGVETVLRCLLAETDLTLALSGHRSVAELGADALVPAA